MNDEEIKQATENRRKELLAILADRKYQKGRFQQKPEPRYRLKGVSICTPGNLTTISAMVRAGKTAAIGALMASSFANPESDCLGFACINPKNHAVVILDTEQSPYDHTEVVERNMRRGPVEDLPPWVFSYWLAGQSARNIRDLIRVEMENAKAQCGGVHSVIIDGTADVVTDVIDPAESNGLVADLHRLAIEFDCPILNVIHVNPGSKSHKTRGHLGSQLERKSECCFKLERTDEIITIYRRP